MKAFALILIPAFLLSAFAGGTKDVKGGYKSKSSDKIKQEAEQILHDVRVYDSLRESEWQRFHAIGSKQFHSTP